MGRKLTTTIAVVSLAAGSLLAYGTALAVNNTGAFELDGNAVTSHTGTAKPDDWDRVCYSQAVKDGASAAAATAKCFGNGDTATAQGVVNATAFSWIDSSNSLEIYTGGGSKDPQDPQTSWLWKPADTIPDKDSILHAFSARYSLPPDPATCPSTDPTCEVIFFGDDRFDNAGDAQLGFWFFKSTVTTTNTSSGGAFKFNGHHTNGDLLVLSDFSNGGTTSSIAVYFWDTTCGSDNTAANKIYSSPSVGQCGANNLRLQGNSTTANCAIAAATSAFCGIANPTLATGTNPQIVPWSYKDKKGNTTKYDQNEFYESGINLSKLGLGGQCYSSFLAESRSSQSPTATLKDFVLGNFQNCDATAVTTPSSSTVSPGTAIHDTMTVTGVGTTNAPYPSSPANVIFAYCGPITSGVCDGSDTAHTATAFGTSKALSATATQGVSSAVSDDINTSGSPLAPGRYCFAGSWAGDANYPNGAKDNGSGECFTVRTIGTSTVTSPSDSTGTALSGVQALGTTIYDAATITAASSGGGAISGSVHFWVCDPSQLDSSSLCSTGGHDLGTSGVTAVSPATTPPSATALSSGYTANVAGTWCFRGVFTPTGSVYTGSSDSAATECVQVGPENTTTKTQASASSVSLNASVTDTAVVAAVDSADGTPTGTVQFYVCNPTTVTANGGDCHTGGTAVGSAATLSALAGQTTPSSTATSSSVTANALGKWCFRAEYTPGGANGGNYNSSVDDGTNECFTVSTTSSGTSAQDWLPNDTVTVSTTGSVALDGSLDITLRSGSCTGTVLYTEPTITLTGAASGSSYSTTNTTVEVTSANGATYYWSAKFTSTNPYVGGFTKCELTTMTINNNP